MITSLGSLDSRWIVATGGGTRPPYLSNYGSMAGAMRYDSSNGVQVYDGTVWHSLNGHSDISLSYEARTTLEWASKKMIEEKQLDELAKEHPGIKDLKEKLDIMIALVRQEKVDNQ